MTLDAVEDVAWHRLHHAYGPATDVPGQLRALRSTDADERRAALAELYGNICHQGTRWQASAAAVPALVTLVDDATTPERAEVLRLLRAVAIGPRRDDELPFDPETAFAARTSIDEEGLARVLRSVYDDGDELDDDEGLALSRAALARWEFDAYAAAAERATTIARWVHDADPEVGARAAALLAWFPPSRESLAALLSVPTDHPYETVAASANLTVAHLRTEDSRIDERIDERLDALLCSADRAVAVTAAVALAYRKREEIPDRAVTMLVGATNEDLPLEVTGWDRALRGFVALALQRLGLG
jgi:hypothetical protein